MLATSINFPSLNKSYYPGDKWLLASVAILIAVGLVMMTSASVEIAASDYGDPLYFLKKHLKFLLLGLIAASIIILVTPVILWKQWSIFCYMSAVILLALVLVPGVGHQVNGSTRWINLGVMTLQASEPAKLFVVMFMAFYLARYRDYVCDTIKGFLFPLVFVILPVMLLLKEPDFGAVVVLMLAVLGMMFMAGVKVQHFLFISILISAAGAALIFSADYRVARLQSFIAALADPFHEDVVFGSGYQLAQALIAFGRGEWFGVGLGNSIQKIYFLPEGHTDFVFAILAEELGAFFVLMLLLVFMLFVCRALLIARKNERVGNLYAAYLAYGVSFLFLGQIVINMAVNVGLLPTKGLTLPFLSSGGSSLITCLVMVGILIKIDIEYTLAMQSSKKTRKAGDHE